MNEPMNIRQHGTVTAVAICPDCDEIAYHVRDDPDRGRREFECAQGHRSFRRWSAEAGKTHDTPQQAAA